MIGQQELELAVSCHKTVFDILEVKPGETLLVTIDSKSDFRIAEMFVESARIALASGGTLLIVTKQPSWYLEHLPETWDDVAQEMVKGYHLIEAVRP